MLGEQSVSCLLTYLIIFFFISFDFTNQILQSFQAHGLVLFGDMENVTAFHVPQSPSCSDLTHHLTPWIAWKSTGCGWVVQWHGVAAGLRGFSLQGMCL